MKSDVVPLEIMFSTFYFLKVQPLISLLEANFIVEFLKLLEWIGIIFLPEAFSLHLYYVSDTVVEARAPSPL